MADFPTILSNVVDGLNGTEILAKFINNLEAKVGIDGSAVVTSLDYLLKNPASLDPGHKHSKLWASDGSPEAAAADASGNIGVGIAPTARLHVAGVASGNALRVDGGASGWTGQYVYVNEYGSLVMRGRTDAANNNLFGAQGLTDTYSRLACGFDSGVPFLGFGPGTAARDVFLRRENGDLIFKFGTSPAEKARFTSGGNLGLGATSFGTSAAKVLGLGSGTAPTTAPADMVQMWSQDIAAGHAAPHFMTELGKIIKLYQQAHLADPAADVGALATWAASINTYLENLGLMATS